MSRLGRDEFLIKPRRTKINIYFETSSAFRKIFQKNRNSHLIVIVANSFYAAFFAFRLTGRADITAMKYQPMMRLRQNLRRDVRHKLTLGFKWRLGISCQSDACRHPKHVSINRHRGVSESDRCHDIRRLPPHSGQLLKLVDT